jgi:hypothetical protein
VPKFLPCAAQSNAQTEAISRGLPLPNPADEKDPAPLAPGLYKTKPYTMLVIVTEPLDQGMLIKAPPAQQFAMRTFEPPLHFERVK